MIVAGVVLEFTVFVALLVSVGALTGFSISVVALRRVVDQPLLWWWSAWSALLAAGVLALLQPFPGASLTALALSPLFSVFTLVGAIRLSGRDIPDWLLLSGFTYCVSRIVLAVAGPEWSSHVLALAVEVPMLLAASWLVFRIPADERGVSGGLIPYALGLVVLVRVSDFWADLTGPASPPLVFWVAASAPLAILQITEAIESSRREARRANRALSESVRRFDAIAAGAQDTILEVDQHWSILYASPNFREILGVDPETLVGTRASDLVHPDDAARVASELGRVTLHPPHRVRHQDGSWRWFESSWRVYRTNEGEERRIGVGHDVTERLRLEEKMRETQKLESLGLLAGGIAHDFNNLLVPILGNTSIAIEQLDADSPIHEILLDVDEGARRAAELTHQLLAYAGRRHREVMPVDLSVLTTDVANLLESTLLPGVTLLSKLSGDLPSALGDPGQIRQVIMNLLTNAAEAIGGGVGTITLRTDVIDVDRVYLDRVELGEWIEPGTFIYVEVTDDGCGMEPDARLRIFDPFFTTKVTGRGLGLAALLGIVRSHGGAVEVSSVLDRGTTFRVLLPPAAEEARVPTPSIARQEVNTTGHGTILVVDDDESVRKLAVRVLKRAGFDCITAFNGREALALIARRQGDIAAVLMDVTMPELRGDAAYLEIRKEYPRLPVVFSSGYSEQDLVGRIPDDDYVGFVEKPYHSRDLVVAFMKFLG